MTDELGRTVAIKAEPQRIVSLAPNITEILFALGLGNKVVGVTSYCNYPAEAAAVTKVGDTLKPSLEVIVSLKPDLVMVSTASQLEQLFSKLEEAGIPVYVLKAQSLEAIIGSVERVGAVTNAQARAAELTRRMRARLEQVSRQIAGKPRPKVFFIVGTEPLITVGKDAYITDLIKMAGGDSITADVAAEWPAYSAETVIARAPDIIIIPGVQHSDNNAMQLPEGLRVTPAARANRVFSINGDQILRPGPRVIDALEEMAKLFHPEAK